VQQSSNVQVFITQLLLLPPPLVARRLVARRSQAAAEPAGVAPESDSADVGAPVDRVDAADAAARSALVVVG